MTQARLEDSGSKKKMITIGVIAVVIGVIIWQVMGLFGGGEAPPKPAPISKPGTPPSPRMQVPGQAPGGTPQQQMSQQQTAAAQAPVLSPREQELMQIQQQTEAKYLAALNELQMLKIEKEIAQTTKDIATARLDTITAQKGVVDLLVPQVTTPNYAGTLAAPTSSGAGAGQGVAGPMLNEVTYTVISVTQLESKWQAVLGSGGTLYQVSVGDIIPLDKSKVISINKSGVVLEKDGNQKKVSMVPII